MLNVDLGIAAGGALQPRRIVSGLASCWPLLAPPLSGTSSPLGLRPNHPPVAGTRASMHVTLAGQRRVTWSSIFHRLIVFRAPFFRRTKLVKSSYKHEIPFPVLSLFPIQRKILEGMVKTNYYFVK